MSFRKQQLNSLIRNEVTASLQKMADVPPGVLLTVTRAEVSTENDKVAVFVSVIPSENKDEAMKMLKSIRGEVQSALFGRLKMRVVPQIHFEYDGGPEKAANIERITMEDRE